MEIQSDSHEDTIVNDITNSSALESKGAQNAAESHVLQIDFRDTAQSGAVINTSSKIGITVGGAPTGTATPTLGTPIEYTATAADVAAANTLSDGSTLATTSNPEQYDIAAQRMAEGLAAAINDSTGQSLARVVATSDGSVSATPTVGNGGVRKIMDGVYEMTVTSTERGRFINLITDANGSVKATPTPSDPSIIDGSDVSSLEPTRNIGTANVNASQSYVTITQNTATRDFQDGDRVTITNEVRIMVMHRHQLFITSIMVAVMTLRIGRG